MNTRNAHAQVLPNLSRTKSDEKGVELIYKACRKPKGDLNQSYPAALQNQQEASHME